MKPFMDEEFLLSTPTAQKLYHDFAETMPILDYQSWMQDVIRYILEFIHFQKKREKKKGGIW